MRPTYIIAACVAALVVLTSAQMPLGPVAGVAAPIVPPVFPPMFAGMPFPFLGPFGFPFLPGLGLGLGLGFGRLGLGLGLGGLGGIGRLGLLRGKRQANASLPVNEIRCVVSTTNSTVQCSFGIDKQVGCQIESRLSEIPKLHVNLVDLMVMQHVEGNVEFLNLVSTKPISAKLTQALTNTKLQSGTFTFIHPSTLKPVLLGIYGDATLGVPGFLVKDQLCYNSLVSLIKTNIGKVRSNLIIA